jgi:ATP-dependent DNA ligase
MLAFVREHGLEGIIAKRIDSVYEPGRKTGLRVKRRINLNQKFVIGGMRRHFRRNLSRHGAALCCEETLTRRQVFEKI